MIDTDTSTYNLLLLLGSRERRRREWIERQRYANWPRPESDYDDIIDADMVVDVAEVLAKRIDAARKNQPDF